jgi:hypothetical protein
VDEREIEEILKSIPEEEPRSQLEPYRELILRLRRQGRTYHRILEIINEKFAVQVAYATLYDFIQRRSRPRNEEPAAAQPAPVTPTPAAQPDVQANPDSDTYAEARERMRRHKEAPPIAKPEPIFPVYTDEESLAPMVLISKVVPKPKEEK